MEIESTVSRDDVEGPYTHDGTLDVKGKPALRRRTGGFRATMFILINQGLVCVSLYGASVNLVLYLTEVLHEGDSSAASNSSNWQGAQYFVSSIGGFLGDAYLGRYSAVLYFHLIFIVGLLLIALSATLPSLRPPSCQNSKVGCARATKLQVGFFYFALYMIALGCGGYQPNVVSFGADQFDEEHPVEKVQKLEFFDWFYVSLTLGTLLSSTVLAYIENEGMWALGFWISTGVGFLALFSFLAPSLQYRFHEVGGNPLTRIAQVVVAAIRKRAVKLPSDSERLYEVDKTEAAIKGSRKIVHTKTLRYLKVHVLFNSNNSPQKSYLLAMFFDKAAAITEADIDNASSQIVPNRWRLCTVTQVEEVKWVCRMLPTWTTTIFYTTAYTQVYSLFVLQGAAMQTHIRGFHVPPAALYVVDCGTVVLCVVLYNYVILPLWRRTTGRDDGITALQRMGLGMPIVAVAMLEAGFVERVRRQQHESGANLSVMWQLPQYITTGISEVFTYIGMMQFFYDQAPDALRSMGSALPQLSVALGNYANSLLLTIVSKLTASPGWIPDSGSLDEGQLDYFFFVLAILTCINFCLFLLAAMYYRYTVRQDLSHSSPRMPILSSPEAEG